MTSSIPQLRRKADARATAPLCVVASVLVSIALLLGACDSGGGTGDDRSADSLMFADVSTDSVFVEDVNDRTVTFLYYGTTPTPCYDLYRVETDGDDDRVRVTVVAAAPVDRFCVNELGQVTAPNLQVTAPVRGTVTFEFSRIGESPITREVDIPVGSSPLPGRS